MWNITHLRCQIFRCTTECFGTSTKKHLLLTQTKISDFDVTIFIQQQILQLWDKTNQPWMSISGDIVLESWRHNGDLVLVTCSTDLSLWRHCCQAAWPRHLATNKIYDVIMTSPITWPVVVGHCLRWLPSGRGWRKSRWNICVMLHILCRKLTQNNSLSTFHLPLRGGASGQTIHVGPNK